jgi:hypothetical protein
VSASSKVISTATTASPATSGTTQGGPLRLAASNGTALDFGAYAASPYGQWIQTADTTNLATTYPLILNPNGGNVGIGTSSPFAKLDVEGRVNIGTGTSQNTFIASSPQLQLFTDGGTANSLGIWQAGIASGEFGVKASDSNLYITNTYSQALGTASHSITLTTAGNVGIGTATPTTALTIRKAIDSAAYGSGTQMIDFKSYFSGYDTETVKASIYAGVSSVGSLNTQSGYLAFMTADAGTLTEKLRIEKNGSLSLKGPSSNSDATNIPINLLFSKSSGSSATGNLSVTTDFTFTGANGWRNCVLTTTASHINQYGGSQGAIEELIHFRTLNASPGIGQITVIRTNTNGSAITLTYSAPSNGILRVVATFNDSSVPGSVPQHELWVNFSMLSPVNVTVA